MGRSRRGINELADRFFDRVLERDPVSATRIGEHRWDAQLPDFGEAGRGTDAADCRQVLAAVEAMDSQVLIGEQAVTREMLILLARDRLEALDQKQYQLAVDHMAGVQTLPTEIAQFQSAERPEQLDALLARFAGYPQAVAQHITTLREGVGDGRTSAAAAVRKTIEQIEEMLSRPPSNHPAVSMAQVANDTARERVLQAVQAHIFPALRLYRDFLVSEYQLAARPEPGLCSTPNGEAAYELAIRLQTTLPAKADELHRDGLAETEAIEAEMDELARGLGHADRHPLRRQLFDEASSVPRSRQQVLDLATQRVRLAEAGARGFFGRLPRVGCIVKPIEEDRERLVGSHYWLPAADGSRPGAFYLNTSPGFPPHLLPSLVAHEATPGHHVQCSIELELVGLPRLRTQLSGTVSLGADRCGGPPLMGVGFAEGWGLYAERLADEMGLYASETERLGMLEQQLVRAVRLVVDTGLHAQGWSREQAIACLHEHIEAPSWIEEMEIDRYTVWPAQALAYKVGQREIERARRDVSERMGDRFDVRVFHDQVLGHGSLPLDILQREILGWVESATSTPR